jgi:hypothetical protein
MTVSVKEAARELVDSLPDDATWEDLAYAVEFRLKVLRGLADARAGRVLSSEEVWKRLGIDE